MSGQTPGASPGFTIDEIAQRLGAPALGAAGLRVGGIDEPGRAGPEQLAVAMSPRYGDALRRSDARAAVLWDGADWAALGLEAAIIVTRPRLAMATLTELFDAPAPPADTGATAAIHPTAIVAEGASLGPGARIGAYAVIGEGARIGARARIGAHCDIAPGVRIGDDCRLDSGVRIARRVRIGARFVAHGGVVIGSDGFSFVTPERSHLEAARDSLGAEAGGKADQAWLKIRSIGGVEIGDDVEIGANSSVDAGTIRPTRLGDGTKLDALVQVGHNVIVGANCLLCAHVAVGGSAVLGDGVVLGGQAGVADNIRIGDGVVAGGASKILSNVPAGRAILGYPAVKMESHVASYKALRRLPRLLQDLARLKKPVPKDGARD